MLTVKVTVLPLQTDGHQTARVHPSTYNPKAPCTALGSDCLLGSHKQRDACLPCLNCTLPGSLNTFWGESKQDSRVNSWRSAPLNLAVFPSLMQPQTRPCFGDQQRHFWASSKVREALPRICVAKEETFQSPHIIYRDMSPAQMLPGNRTFLWERTQTTHLAGMPILRAWDSIKTWGALCSQISIIWQGLGAYLPYGGLSS